MNVEEKRSKTVTIFSIGDARKNAKEAIISHLLRRTVGLVNEVRLHGTVSGRAFTEEESGTGCLVKWKSRYFILTAEHVIETARSAKDIRVVSFAKSPVRFVPPDQVNAEDSDPGENLGGEIYRCGWEDLAVLTVPDDRFGEFAEIDQEWVDPDVGDLVGSIGLPSDNHKVLGHQSYGNKTDVVVGVMPTLLDVDVLPPPDEDDLKFKVPQHVPGRQYFIKYDSPHSTNAHGMSGAGVWFPKMSYPPGVWSPTFSFAGICISVYDKGYSAHRGPVVEVVKASVVRTFLEETFG